jgi:hypothetical protein
MRRLPPEEVTKSRETVGDVAEEVVESLAILIRIRGKDALTT